MRNRLYHILSIAGTLVLFGATSALAQPAIAMKASIPFSFRVQGAVLPQGDYSITFLRNENWGGVALLKNPDTQKQIKVFVRDGTGRRLKDSAYLVFNSYGDQNFLSQIWSVSGSPGSVVPTSRDEQEIIHSTQANGKKGLSPRPVLIAAH